MNYYNQISQGYEELHREEQIRKLNKIKDYLETNDLISSSDKILDIGCGPGFTSEFFQNEITGIEPSNQLAKKADFLTHNVRAEEINLEEEYDIVMCITALHNFDNPRKALSKIRTTGELFIITILKKSDNQEELKKLLQEKFQVEYIIDDKNDEIMILTKHT